MRWWPFRRRRLENVVTVTFSVTVLPAGKVRVGIVRDGMPLTNVDLTIANAERLADLLVEQAGKAAVATPLLKGD